DVFVPAQGPAAFGLLELVIGLEGAVVVGSLAPGHIDCSRNMTATLRLLLRQVCGGQQPAGVFIGAANIDQALATDRCDYLVAEGSDIEVGLGSGVARGRSGDRFGAQLAGVELPLLAATVRQRGVFWPHTV